MEHSLTKKFQQKNNAESDDTDKAYRDQMAQTLVYNSKEALRQMKALAARKGTTLSALIGRSMNLTFREEGLPEIAIETPKRGGKQ